MVIDAYMKREQELATPAPDAAKKSPTLTENLKDASKSKLLGAILAQRGADGKELADRMFNPKPGDLERFEVVNNELNEMAASIDEVGTSITPENVAQFASFDPTLAKQLKLASPEQYAKVFKNKLAEIAVADAPRFNAIRDNLQKLKTFKTDPDGAYAKLSKEVSEKCKAVKISEEKFVDIMQNSDPEQRIALFREEIKKSLPAKGFWRREVRRSLRADDAARGLESGVKRADLETLKDELKSKLKDLGGLMSEAVENNPELLTAFMREVTDTKEEKVPEKPFKDVGRDMPKQKQLVEDWEQVKSTTEYRNLKTDADRGAYLDRWMDKRQEAETDAAEKRGFWAQIGLALVKAMFDETKKAKKFKL